VRRISRRGFLAVGLLIALAAVAVLAGVILLRARLPLPAVGTDPWTTSATIHSDLLGRDRPIEVFAPPAAQACAVRPLLLLFHGYGADERQWMNGVLGDGLGIDSTAHELIAAGRMAPVTIVSAQIDNSYGVDSTPRQDMWDHGPYESYILNELLPQVEARYSVGGDAAHRAVAGLSMGGFAALNAAFRNPQLFDRAGGLSPAFFVSPPADRAWIYSGADGRHDLLALANEGAADDMHIFLGYGDNDYGWVKQATRALASELTDRGQAVDPVVVPGGHEVATWRQLTEPMLLDLFPPGC
jgi:enterochelin esterase-like enzyme